MIETMVARRYGPPIAAAVIALASAVAILRGPGGLSNAQAPAPRGNWPMYQLGPAHNAVVDRPGFRANWLAKLGDKINGGLAVDDRTVYVDSFDKKLYAIDLRTGAIRWSASADNILMSTPVIEDGVVIVGSGMNGFLKPNDADSQVWGRPEGDDILAYSTSDGHLLWKVHTIGQNMPSPAIARGAAILANGDLHAYALDVRDGKRRWTVPLQGVAAMSSATVDDGMVFLSTCHNAPYFCETRALDVRDGHTIWTNPNGGSDCSPTVADGLLFVTANRDDTEHYHTGGYNVTAAIDEHTGKTIWTHVSEPGPYTFVGSNERQIAGAADGGVLYQPIGNASKVIAFDDRTGKVIWSVRTSANVKMSPVVKDNTVYFGDTAGIFYRVDRLSGRILHTSSYLQPFATSPPVIVGETLFVADGQYVVAAPLQSI
ncbi:MAG TPA: PQQ-binding-like beta-propeller repeat protein [Candidatus Baltobacteraceae bacterium]|nr:PQQ-binding-like beta-propeller repeat protein [Candidatus Baltobacteraceae bacterium]